MKVLHVNDCAGVARNLIDGLKSLDVQAELFQPSLGTYRASALKRAILPLIRTKESLQLCRYVRQKQFDVVHIHYAPLAYMALLTGLPYVLHCHGSDLRVDLHRPVMRNLVLLAVRKANKVFYATPDLEQYLQGVHKDAVFLPDPIRANDFLTTHPNSQCSPSVLSISKLDKFKGIEHIFQIIELLWKTRPQVNVAIFDFGNARERFGPLIQGNQSRLRLLPRVSHQEMPGLIGSFPVILGQQNHEIAALGVSELEAMACAKPVVCAFAHWDAYNEPPPVLSAQSPMEAHNHIIQLLDDPDLGLRIGEQSRQWVMRHHDHRQVASALFEHYLQL